MCRDQRGRRCILGDICIRRGGEGETSLLKGLFDDLDASIGHEYIVREIGRLEEDGSAQGQYTHSTV